MENCGRDPQLLLHGQKKCEIAMEIRNVLMYFLSSTVEGSIRFAGMCCGFGNLSTHNFWVSDIYVHERLKQRSTEK